jgi:phosphatidylglycerophosphate synthase
MIQLTPPKHLTFYISVAIAVIALIIHYAHVEIPHVHSGFVILLVGYLVLVAGNVLDGV